MPVVGRRCRTVSQVLSREGAVGDETTSRRRTRVGLERCVLQRPLMRFAVARSAGLVAIRWTSRVVVREVDALERRHSAIAHGRRSIPAEDGKRVAGERARGDARMKFNSIHSLPRMKFADRVPGELRPDLIADAEDDHEVLSKRTAAGLAGGPEPSHLRGPGSCVSRVTPSARRETTRFRVTCESAGGGVGTGGLRQDEGSKSHGPQARVAAPRIVVLGRRAVYVVGPPPSWCAGGLPRIDPRRRTSP
jgi:hypothetical protein